MAYFPGGPREQASVATSALLKPYPQHGNVTQVSTDPGEFQNPSIQLRLQRPLSHGFSFMVSYAHVVADSRTFYDDQDPYDGLLRTVAHPN